MNRSLSEVYFKVLAQVGHGEEIRVSGNCPALGCDDPSRAIPLTASVHEYPWWQTSEALFLPSEAGVVKYRYCVYSGGEFSRWEADGTLVRTVDKSERFTTNMIDTFGLRSSEAPLHVDVSMRVAANNSLRSRQFQEWNKKCLIDASLQSSDSVMYVSYFLPVNLSRSEQGVWSATWESENLLALNLSVRQSWVGSVRYEGKEIPEWEQDAVSDVLRRMNCYPVFISNTTHVQFYDEFCKRVMWPLLHLVQDVYGPLNSAELNAKAQQDLWFVYSTVNSLFRKKVVEVYQEGDMIWIHGFHLMQLPSFLRRGVSKAKIGFFLHTPFPSSEIWRMSSRREELIRGMLSADHIGFHLYEYARHFKSVCHRVLGLPSQINAAGKLVINVDGREVAISAIHVGVDAVRVTEVLSAPSFERDVSEWKTMFGDKVVIAGIDRLERLKGIPLKLLAIEQFMDQNLSWNGKVLFVIIGISAKEREEDYRQTQRDVKYLVNRLNAKFHIPGSSPLIHFQEYHEKEAFLPRRMAFFAAVDVFMSTATRDGLNRMPIEFTLAKQRASQFPFSRDLGVIIISEFTSSARVMRGALKVNPWKIAEVSLAIKQALDMDSIEKQDRAERNLSFSCQQTTTTWAEQLLLDLKGVEKSETDENFVIGFGMGLRVLGVRAGFNELDLTSVSRSYRESRCRLIVLDWGGTLVTEMETGDKLLAYSVAQGYTNRSSVSRELADTLKSLCSDPNNTVFVLSGKQMYSIEEVFGDFPGLGLGAEHGFYFRWPQSMTELLLSHSDRKHKSSGLGPAEADGHQGGWHTIHSLGDQSWKKTVEHIMDLYVQRTHGTYIERKGSALIWQFRDADPEFGFLQSKELEDHLKMTTANLNLVVIRGGGVSDGYIEVRPSGVNKGLFVKHIMAELKSAHKSVDFILAVGDDVSDEPMFELCNELTFKSPSSSTTSSREKHIAVFTSTVGKKPSAAQSYVNDPSSVHEILRMLVRQGTITLGKQNSIGSDLFGAGQRSMLSSSNSFASGHRALSMSNLQSVNPKPFTLSGLPNSRQNSQNLLSGNGSSNALSSSSCSTTFPQFAPTMTTDDQEYNADYVAGPVVRNPQPAAMVAPQYPVFSTDEDYGIDMIDGLEF